MKPCLILVNGYPGVGKTTLSRRLASDLALPLFEKDVIKEMLYDGLGGGEPAWVRKLGAVSYDLLYHLMERELSVGRSILIEGVFSDQLDRDRFQDLLDGYPLTVVQVVCKTPVEIAYERFHARYHSGDRHPSHPDDLTLEGYRERFVDERVYELAIESEVIPVDMSSYENMAYDLLMQQLQDHLGNG